MYIVVNVKSNETFKISDKVYSGRPLECYVLESRKKPLIRLSTYNVHKIDKVGFAQATLRRRGQDQAKGETLVRESMRDRLHFIAIICMCDARRERVEWIL